MNHTQISRRSFLGLTCAFTGLAVTGCQSKTGDDQAETSASIRTDVPLRIALCGTQADADSIARAWKMSDPQPLEINVVPTMRQVDSEAVSGIVAALAKSDIGIYPQLALGAIASNDAAVEFSDLTLEQFEKETGPLLSAARIGLGRFGGRRWGVPVGGKLFAVLSTESENNPDTWSQYHDWIKTLGGKAAEPLGKRWAGSAFLNRCALSIDAGWLFDRGSMKPEIDAADYVDVLTQLRDTAKHYENIDQDPREIWSGLRSGRLKGGIGFEVPVTLNSNPDEPESGEPVDEFDVSVASCPVESKSDRLWFDCQTPLATVGAGCRQTDASKRFIRWMAGGQGSESLSSQLDLFSTTRDGSQAANESESGPSNAGQTSEYSRWLATRLRVRQVVAGLVLPGAERYYRALDQQIVDCVNGKVEPADALAAVAKSWESITDELGRKEQIAAWRQSM